jgi:drug/metabolite transporter (DMT)-like permease
LSLVAAAIALALVASLIHATWNVLVKIAGDPMAVFWRATVAAWVVITVPIVVAWLMLGRPGFSAEAAGLCAVSATIETIYLWLLAHAYRRGELSVVYPIARGSAPLLAVLAGLILIGERLAPLQLAGVGILLIGIVGVALAQANGRATLPALLTGVAIAAYTSVDRIAVRLTTPWLYGWLLITIITVELVLSVWLVHRLRPDWAPRAPELRGYAHTALIGLFMWGGYFIVLWALTLAPLALVAPVRETSIVVVAVWGVWRLRERRGVALKLAGAVAALIGIALLAA